MVVASLKNLRARISVLCQQNGLHDIKCSFVPDGCLFVSSTVLHEAA